MVSSMGMLTYKSFMSKVISLWLSLILSLVRLFAKSVEPLLHLVGILFPHINDDARSKSHQISRILPSNKFSKKLQPTKATGIVFVTADIS